MRATHTVVNETVGVPPLVDEVGGDPLFAYMGEAGVRARTEPCRWNTRMIRLTSLSLFGRTPGERAERIGGEDDADPAKGVEEVGKEKEELD